MLLPGLAYLCRLLSLLGLFWGAYQSYKVLKPKFQVEGSDGEEAVPSTRSRSRSSANKRRKTLLRFADGYDSSSGSRMLYYWACLSALFVYSESPAESLVQFFVPFYFEAKLLLLIALLLPNSNAPQWLFERALHPFMRWAGDTADRRVFPWLAGLIVESVFNRFLPRLFAWIAPFLHPSDLQAWERLIDKLRRRLEVVQGSGRSQKGGATKRRERQLKEGGAATSSSTSRAPQQLQPATATAPLGILSWGWNAASSAMSAAAGTSGGRAVAGLFGAQRPSDDAEAEGSSRGGSGNNTKSDGLSSPGRSPARSSRSPSSAGGASGRSTSDGNAITLRRRKILATAASSAGDPPSIAAAAEAASQRRPYESSDDDEDEARQLGYGCARQPSTALPPLPQSIMPEKRSHRRTSVNSNAGGGRQSDAWLKGGSGALVEDDEGDDNNGEMPRI